MKRVVLSYLFTLLTVGLFVGPVAARTPKFDILYQFSGGSDGGGPMGPLIFDTAGNLYGTTVYPEFGGTVFRLSRGKKGSWEKTILYSFTGKNDGGQPVAGLVFDADGNLYGTTESGGTYSFGTAFELVHGKDGSWTEKVLHNFCGPRDGCEPESTLVFDTAGNLYGTTTDGGRHRGGTVFRLTPNPDGTWTEKILHNFCSTKECRDGHFPDAGLVFDQAGSLYGTTERGGAHNYQTGCGQSGCGIVFRLSPGTNGAWIETILHNFCSGNDSCLDGAYPFAGVAFDGVGNLYGTTERGGPSGDGTVFELIPQQDGTWKEKVLHGFSGSDGQYPVASVTPDPSGNLYGTALQGGSGDWGVVFQLSRFKGGKWNFTVLTNFDTQNGQPWASVILDDNGNIYGADVGQDGDLGSIYEVLP